MALTLKFGPADEYNVLDYGAVGDGSTDDGPAIRGCLVQAAADRVGRVIASPTANGYLFLSKDDPANNKSGCIRMPPNMEFVGHGTKLIMGTDTHFIRIASRDPLGVDTIASSYGPIVTADTVLTDANLTVNDSSLVTLGQNVLVLLGQSPIGAGDPAWFFFATVLAIPDATHVTLDQPVCYALSVAATPNTLHRMIYPIAEMAENIVVKGFDLINPMTGGARAAEGIYIQVGRNVTLDEITGQDPGAGMIALERAEHIDIPRVCVRQSTKQSGLGAFGRGLSFASSRNVHVGLADLSACENQFLFQEIMDEDITIDVLKINNNFPSTTTTGRPNGAAGDVRTAVPLIQHSFRSDTRYNDIFATGNGAYLYGAGGATDTHARIKHTSFAMTTDPLISEMFAIEQMRLRTFDYFEIKRYSKTFALSPSMASVVCALPSGLCRRLKIFASTTTGITLIRLSDGVSNSTGIQASLVSGGQAMIALASGLDAVGNYVWNNTEGKRLLVTTDGTVPAGAFLAVEMEYFVAQGLTDDGSSAREDVLLERAALRTITYSASMTPDNSGQRSVYHQIVITNGTAMAINAPTTPLVGQTMTLDILNSNAGAHGAITMNGVYLLQGGGSTLPAIATTKRRAFQFMYNGTSWIQTVPATADIG